MAYIKIDDLIEIDEALIDDSAFTMVMKPLMGNSSASYKMDLNVLSGQFLSMSDLGNIENDILKFREDLEKTLETFELEEYFPDNNYMTKEEADRQRKKLLTYDNFSTVLQNYMTMDALSIDLEDSARDLYNVVNSYASTMLNASTTAKSSNSQIAAMQEAIDSIGEDNTGGEEDAE